MGAMFYNLSHVKSTLEIRLPATVFTFHGSVANWKIKSQSFLFALHSTVQNHSNFVSKWLYGLLVPSFMPHLPGSGLDHCNCISASLWLSSQHLRRYCI